MKRVPAGRGEQLHLREVDGAGGGAHVGILDQLARHLGADALLRLLGRAADVRGEDDVVEALQRAHELLGVGRGLDRKHVDGRAGELLGAQRRRQGLEIDHGAARVVDEERARLHAGDLAPRRSCPAWPASRARAGSPRRPAPADRRACRWARRCRGAACRCGRSRARACPWPRPAPRAGCRCCRSRRCRASCRAPRWSPTALLSQPPACAAADLGKMRRISMTISAMVSSATERVLENGALKTGMPMVRQAARSTWLVPTEKQPTATSALTPSTTSAVSWVRERMPSRRTPLVEGLAQLRGVERLGAPVDLGVAGGLEEVDGRLGDALQQQDPDLVLGQRIGERLLQSVARAHLGLARAVGVGGTDLYRGPARCGQCRPGAAKS